MHRTASLVVGLALALLSLVPLAAAVAAQQTLPAEFVGRWEGTASHRVMAFSSPVTIDLSGASVGSVVGTVEYPVGLDRLAPCSGVLVLQSVAADEREVTLREDIDTGEGNCPLSAATVTLTLQTDGSLVYDWRHPGLAGDPFAGPLLATTGCRWTGTWWSSVYGYLRLSQSGNTVSGDYEWDQGQISGTISGATLSGTWNEVPSQSPDPADAGQLVFTMAADCQSFIGQWRYGSSGQWYTDWAGERVAN